MWAILYALIPWAAQVFKLPEIVVANSRLKRLLNHVRSLRKAQDEIAYGTSHRLKESVRTIHYQLTNLIEEQAVSLPNDVIDEIEGACKKAGSLHAMLEEAIIHSNLLACQLRLEEVNLVSFVEKMTQEYGNSGIQLEIYNEVEPEEQSVILDAKLMEWAFNNCLKKCFDFMDPKAEKLLLEIGKVREESHAAEYFVRMIFMSATHPDDFGDSLHIFQDSTEKTSLCIASRILSRHEGHVRVARGEEKNHLMLELTLSDGASLREEQSGIKEKEDEIRKESGGVCRGLRRGSPSNGKSLAGYSA